MRTLAGKSFQNQKLCKEWIKSQLVRIAFSNHITKEDKDLLHQIIKGHPDQEYTEGVTDFSIYFDMYNNIALDIWKGETRESISWVKCSTGRKITNHQKLMKAMRYSVESQINEFRQKVPKFCEECGNTENLQVDHIIMFKDLIKEFNHNREPPTEFNELGRHELIFKEQDKQYENDWIQYHKDEATLRILCQKHNLARNLKK
jgi:hypothetical protein